MSRLRSPLRMPGGKSRVAALIMSHFPNGIDTLISPFMGGGGVELLAAQQGLEVIAYDGFKPLVIFWQHLLKTPSHLADLAQTAYPMPKEKFSTWQNLLSETDSAVNACVFFVVNRASFSGTTMSGGCSDPSARFTQSSIDRLREFVNFQGDLTVEYSLWPDTLVKHPDYFMYLDPPYMIGPKIYGVRGDMHKSFDHQGLATALRARTAPWLLSYNDCEEVRALYEGCTIKTAEWSNSMGKSKKQLELLIRNYA